MQFAGKFAFQATNATGEQCFLTAYVARGASAMPSVSAPAHTASENLVVYELAGGGYVVSMLVAGVSPGTVDVLWCVGLDSMLYLVTTAEQADAEELQISGLDAAQSTWSISYEGDWVALAYVPPSPPTNPTAYLVYAVGNLGEGRLTALANVPVTPGYTAIMSAGSAPPGADFTYADLSGLDFGGADLTGCDFTGATLSGASLAGATLTGATFTAAALDDVDFSGATLTGADFAGTNLSTVTWGSALSAAGADFTGCVMVATASGSVLAGADLSGATLVGADLSRVDLTGADLSSAALYGANLTAANLTSAVLTSAQLGASGGWPSAVLSYATMSGVSADLADLSGVDCSYATLNGATTGLDQAATLQQANFANAYLKGISFAGSNLQGAVFDGACLVDVDFTRADLSAPAGGLSAASLVSTCLQGAVFTSADLTGANLANAAVSTADGTVPVRFCSTDGPIPPAAGHAFPLSCKITTSLDETTLMPTTICPNGTTYAANVATGVTLAEMLSAPGAPGTGSPPSVWTQGVCMIVAG